MATRTLPSAPVAIVGIGCRFPKADDPESYWRNIVEGRACFSEIPRDRWNHDVFFSTNQRDIDKAWTSSGGFIENIKEFAALHYGIAPRRLEVMDPQQRLLIEATRVAVQDAGYEARPFNRQRAGVFMGVSVSEFKNLCLSRINAMQMAAGEFGSAAGSQELRDVLMEMTAHVAPLRAFSLSGSLTALAASSISQVFDFGGPSYIIDAACASASVAISDAVVQLRAGLIDSALAGGVYVNLTPDNLIAFTRIGAISPTGVCRPFDSRADGFVQSDGVGVVFLKRLEDALADNDRIYAVIIGTGCNNDGRGEGPMTPRVEGQLGALRAAYADAGCSPASIAYFEAHGTATAVGDPVEIEALGRLLAEASVPRDQPALLGSVKGNIGHAMAAAGIAGVIKAIKIIQHRVAPPQGGYASPHPVLQIDRWPIRVNDRANALQPRDGAPLRVAVSSFGFGGTNSHLILEESPLRPRPPRVSRSVARDLAHETGAPASSPEAPLPEAVIVSAPNARLLASHARTIADALEGGPLGTASLADVAYTLNARRRFERLRAVVPARTSRELIDGLRQLESAFSNGKTPSSFPHVVSPQSTVYDHGSDAPRRAASTDGQADHEADAARPKIAFLFPGQGAQKLGLLGHLRRRFPRFAATFADLEGSVSDLLPRPLSTYLYPEVRGNMTDAERAALESDLTATEICQPAMAALGLSLAALLEDAGVVADVSLGHSLGEFAALAHARIIDPAAAVRMVALRGITMRDLDLEDRGTMAAVMCDPESVRAAIAGIDGVWIANTNHPKQVSISGTNPGVERACQALRARGIEVRHLAVSHAFHTPLLSGIDEKMAQELRRINWGRPRHAVASCVSAEAYGNDAKHTEETILKHATVPVDFVRGLHQARAAGARVFVHVGAGSLLTSFTRATFDGSRDGVVTVTLAPLDDDGGFELVRGLATLAAIGVPVDFESVYRGEGRRVVALPETPLERESYWPIKHKPQPKPQLDFPLPDRRDGRSIIVLKGQLGEEARRAAEGDASDRNGGQGDSYDMTTRSNAHGSEELVRLFAKQAEVLRTHAEIIAEQNRLLSERTDEAGAHAPRPVRSQASGAPSASTANTARADRAAPSPSPSNTSSVHPPAGNEAALRAPEETPPTTGRTPPPTTRASLEPAGRPAPPPPAAQAATPSNYAGRAESAAHARERVFEIVARISAFPRESLRGEQRLVDELGFDSLMVADLGGALESAYPNLGGLPASLFSLTTTVADIADHIARTIDRPPSSTAPRNGHEQEPPAPITMYRPVATRRRRAALSNHDVRGETWLVTEDGSELSAAISAALEARGARTVRVRLTTNAVAAADRLGFGGPNLWPAAFAEGLPSALSRSGLAIDGLIHTTGLSAVEQDEFVNPVLELHPIAQGIDVKRMITVTALGGRLGLDRSEILSRNLPQAALLGYTKALARERPAAVVRALDVDPRASAQENAEWIIEEALGSDLTVEVGFCGGERYVAELVPPERAPGAGTNRERPITSHDVVLITGGTGDIGARIALEIAAKGPRGVVLVGRRPEDNDIRALLDRISRFGTKATYVSADVNDPAALAGGVKNAFPEPVTIAIHAAGVIEDAPATRKSVESVARVMNVKALGARSVLRAFPELRDLILLSSWAGRFGNAGQTDYSAANDLLDRMAVLGFGSVRIASIVLPPWESTKMARSIPHAIQSSMKAEGVTFLEDREGLDMILAILTRDLRGIEVVGRSLPRLETRARYVEGFGEKTHPFLHDHQLKGKPVLPMASALDLVAFVAKASEGGTDVPDRAILVEDMELVRGIFGGDVALVRSESRASYEAGTRARIEVRASRPSATASTPGNGSIEPQGSAGAIAQAPVAYRALVHLPPAISSPDVKIELEGENEPLPFDLDEFYRERTFHGPMLRGIERVERMTPRGITGTVRTSTLRSWMPDSDRSSWAIDPLVVDGSFQLAAYWALVHFGRSGYPTGFDRFTLLRAFGDAPIRCTVVLRAVSHETFEGDIAYEDLLGRRHAVLSGVRGRFADVAAPAAHARSSSSSNGSGIDSSLPSNAARESVAPSSNGGAQPHENGNGHGIVAEVPEENWNISVFPEVEMLDQRIQMAELIGLKNPYFHVHAGTARNRSIVDGIEMLNFSSYNYLGFSGHPEVVAAAKEAIERYGTSVSASRVASGERPIHRQLEEGIAEHVGVEDAIVFVSGHATNVTTIGHLFDRNDLILHDSLIHDSILQGIYLSGATRRPFPHGDLEALEKALGQIRRNYRRVLLCAEGIYSMDGDTSNVPRLIDLKKRFKCLLLIDEAHSIGVLGPSGRGVGHHFSGVSPRDVDLWMGTLSKSFASCGGYIAGSRALVRYLKYTAPGFVYSAGITPPNAASALKALELMHRHPEIVERLRQRSKLFLDLARAKGVNTGHAIGAAVIPAIVGNSLDCMRLSEGLARRKINVQPIVYPAVEDNAARLRFFISATHTEEEIRNTVDLLVEELERVRRESASSGLASVSV